MRLEVGTGNVTEAIAGIIESLQAQPTASTTMINNLGELARLVASSDRIDPPRALELFETIQHVRNVIETLAFPPGVNHPDNDTPTASF